jgi:hypothetical protein
MNHQKIGLWIRHDRAKHAHLSLSRLAFLAIIVFLLGLVLLIQACDPVAATKERENMTKTNSVPYQARPPIDLSGPAKTETATFALG